MGDSGISHEKALYLLAVKLCVCVHVSVGYKRCPSPILTWVPELGECRMNQLHLILSEALISHGHGRRNETSGMYQYLTNT